MSAESILNFLNVGRDKPKCLVRVRDWKQIVEVLLTVRGPGKMARNQKGLYSVDERANSPQVCSVNAISAPYRNTDRVNGDRVVRGQIDQEFHRVWICEEILGMHFQPSNGRTSGHNLDDMRESQTNTGSNRLVSRRHGKMATRKHRMPLFGFQIAADNAFTVAGRNVYPGLGVPVDLG
jgi:hypothetical protein